MNLKSFHLFGCKTMDSFIGLYAMFLNFEEIRLHPLPLAACLLQLDLRRLRLPTAAPPAAMAAGGHLNRVT